MTVYNGSSTASTNTNYEINWGDGQTTNLSNAWGLQSSTSHTYPQQGYFTIQYVVSSSTCKDTSDYSVYIGSNPSVPFTNPGATTSLCLPATISIPSNNFFNSPGTIYIVTHNDNNISDTLNHPPPPFYNHTFNLPSCGATGGTNPNSFYIKKIGRAHV